MDACDTCGYEYDLAHAVLTGPLIIEAATDLADLLDGGGPKVRTRQASETWSALEYGCHVRDVLLVQRERILLARRRDRPSPEPMGRDERVDHDGYAEQHPRDVARQLRDAALLFTHVLARLGPEDWDRVIVYSYPATSERSLRWVAVHTLHEVRHHLADARRQLAG